jgi:peptide/nickel transport system substrate-binding protein
MRRLIAACLATLLATPAWAQSHDTLTIDLPGDVATMDPQIQWDTDSYSVYRNIFDNLVTRDPSGKIIPQVATDWHYANDTSVVFNLRTDITFHDGTKLTPEDVVFSVQRITNPAFKSPQLSQFDQITSAEVTGPAQVTLHTKSPYPVLLAQLVKLSIIPKAYVQKVGDTEFNQHVIGSGPFKLASWQRGVQTNLVANDSYWRGKPSFKTVTFRAVPDTATRIADLKTGRADITRGLSPDDATDLKSAKGLDVRAVATERVAYLFVNTLFGPTKDRRVRQAIAMAVDRDTIISALQQGFAKPTSVVLSPVDFGYDPTIKPWPYDPDAARKLIKEAGAEGATIPFLTSPAYDRRLNEAVQQMLADVGLKVVISVVDQPTYLKRRLGTPDEASSLSQGRWSCGCLDADGVIFPLFRSGSVWSKFANPGFDAEVDAARATLDEKQRLAHYHKAFEILHDEVPGVGLFQDEAIYLLKHDIAWTPTPDEAFFVYDMHYTD